MTQRTIEVSGDDVFLSIKHGQIKVRRGDEEAGIIPTEDVGILIVDTPSATYSHSVMTALLEAGAVIVFCGSNHLPVGMMVPTVGHHVQSERFRMQLAASEATTKRIWKQVVQEKLNRQGALCEEPAGKTRLERLAGEVKPGDPDNREALGAQVHWKHFLAGTEFRRDPEAGFPNTLLNYGYAAMRAAVARAIVAAGFHPSLGIKHSNRYNAFCLADDLMEPLRPVVDERVRDMIRGGTTEIDRESKRGILEVLHWPFVTESGEGPLVHTLERYLASFHRCLERSDSSLEIPAPVPEPRSPSE